MSRMSAIAIAVVVVLTDQVTKRLAVSALADGPLVLIEDFLQFRRTFNTGASFSILSGWGEVIAVIALFVVFLIIYILKDVERELEVVSLGLVLGGTTGNVFDRLTRGSGLLDGAVVDFIDFSFFATFNVADIAINIGVALLLISAFWRRK